MKKKFFLTIMVALSVTIAGCGSKDSNIVENQKEVTIKDTDNKKTEKQKKNLEKDTEKSEESGSKEETIVKEDEKAAAQQTASTDGNASDTNSSSNGNTANNNGSDHTAGNSNSGSTSGSTSSGGSSSGGSSNSSTGNSIPVPEPAQPVHTHTWVHVDATGHYETVTIQAAWDEQVPVYEEKEFSICNVCGADITGNTTEHTKNHALAYEGGGYHSEWRQVQIGTQTIHHDAVIEQRWVEDTPAYDVCSGCGAIK